jgi:hypothetical protein
VGRDAGASLRRELAGFEQLHTGYVSTYNVCMNITLSVDDRLIEEARRLAQARGTSLNQLVRDYLEALVHPHDVGGFGAELRRLTAEGRGHSAGWHFDREALHERR